MHHFVNDLRRFNHQAVSIDWICSHQIIDGENHGKPYEQMDDLGGFPIIFGNTHIILAKWNHISPT